MTTNNSHRPFINYLLASSLWLAGVTLAGFLGSWLLVDRLDATPEQTGLASMVSRLAPIGFLLAGGVLTDRSNSRSYLVLMHVLITLPGIALMVVMGADHLSYLTVVVFMASMAAVQGLSDPARQAVLNRLAPTDIQRSVAIVALAGSVVAYLAISFAGTMDEIGDNRVLLVMCVLFALSLWPILSLPSLRPPTPTILRGSVWSELSQGARAVTSNRLLRGVIGCNFVSSMFNAGAYTVAIPFIAKDVYSGDAQTYSTALGAITLGAGLSSALLLVIMPFVHPGRIFLCFQLSRAVILALLWANFGEWAFYALMALWGVNMGVTSTLARSVVQTAAPEIERGRIFSLMLLSFMVASTLGAPILGAIVGVADPLGALLPGVAISLLIFVWGSRTGLWTYRDACLT